MEELIKLYKIYSPSKKEKPMREFLTRRCTELCATVRRDNGNLYVTKGVADTYPCVVAHMDQVQELHSQDFSCAVYGGMIHGYSAINRRPEGLGADDKNGIWIALRCLEYFDVMKCAFFWGEEMGCLGSDNADMIFFDDCRFVLQCDKRGRNDFISSIMGVELCSRDFVRAVGLEQFNYTEAAGALTDVYTLKTNGLPVSCCNISCGYYEPHTDSEYTVIDDLRDCLRLVVHIIKTCTGIYPHDYFYPVYDPHDYKRGGWYNDSDFVIGRDLELDELISCFYGYDLELLPTAEQLQDWYQYIYPSLTTDDYKYAVEHLKAEATDGWV